MKLEGISQGLAMIPSGIFVIGTAYQEQRYAMLASFVQQAGFDPPMIVIATQKKRPINSIIQESNQFVVNIMSKESKESLKRFWQGVAEDGDPFENLDTSLHKTKIPVLKDALGFLECNLKSINDAGDHYVIIGQVLNGGRIKDGDPLVRVRKNGFDY